MQEIQVQSLVSENSTHPGQLGPCTTNTESMLQRPGYATTEAYTPQGLCSAPREAIAMRSPHTTTQEEPPLTTTREKTMQQWRPSTTKKVNFNFSNVTFTVSKSINFYRLENIFLKSRRRPNLLLWGYHKTCTKFF